MENKKITQAEFEAATSKLPDSDICSHSWVVDNIYTCQRDLRFGEIEIRQISSFLFSDSDRDREIEDNDVQEVTCNVDVYAADGDKIPALSRTRATLLHFLPQELRGIDFDLIRERFRRDE